VKLIPERYFLQFPNLETFCIYAEIHELGQECFCLCSNLKTVILSPTLAKIGNGCFLGCGSLTKINIPKGVTEIGDWCFFSTRLFSGEGTISIEKGSTFNLEKITKISHWDNVKKKFAD
jgi:hypothetical protein